jgi:hypothetical protein
LLAIRLRQLLSTMTYSGCQVNINVDFWGSIICSSKPPSIWGWRSSSSTKSKFMPQVYCQVTLGRSTICSNYFPSIQVSCYFDFYRWLPVGCWI